MHQTQTIPPYLIDHILPHLPLPDLLRCLRVNRLWHDSIVHLPAFRAPLFQQAPRSKQFKVEQLTLHPVLDKIAVDWSIVLTEPVFAYSQTSKPKLLNDVTVADAMATYPGVSSVMLELVMERKPEPVAAAARARAEAQTSVVEEPEKRAVTTVCVPIERAEGVRVRDVWAAVVSVMGETKHGFSRPAVRSAARGGRRQRQPKQTLRETIMKGDFITFGWSMHVSTDSSPKTTTSSTVTVTPTPVADPSPASRSAAEGTTVPTTAPTSPSPKPFYTSATLHGHTYTHFYTDLLALEKSSPELSLLARDADNRPLWLNWNGTRLAETRVVDVSF